MPPKSGGAPPTPRVSNTIAALLTPLLLALAPLPVASAAALRGAGKGKRHRADDGCGYRAP